jgi:flavin-dependent dehydrogenase
MTDVIVVGGSVAGLATALALAQAGARVTVLERGHAYPSGPLPVAIPAWTGGSVPQRQHSHSLTSLGVRTLRKRAPQILDAACAAGAILLDLTAAMPARPAARAPGDEDLVALGCRRSLLDLILYRSVRETSGVRIRHRTSVAAVTVAAGRVTGVVTGPGETLRADLVIDATGGRAESGRWLAAAGIEPGADRVSPSELRVFSRHYRFDGPPGPLNRGNAAGTIGDDYGAVLHPTGRDTFSVAIGVLPGDDTLNPLRRPGAFTRVLRATPGIDAWFRDSQPVAASAVLALTCPPNVLRAAAAGASPVPGLIPVGDAACVTDPLYGRGMSLALTHAFAVADLVTRVPGPGPAQAYASAALARELFEPWYRQAVADGADRIARWRGLPPPAPTPLHRAGRVAVQDPVVWRGVMRVLMGLRDPDQVYGDADFADRVARAGHPVGAATTAPTRRDLLAAVHADEVF